MKKRRHVATIADFDGAEMGDDVKSDAREVEDTESDDVEVGDDAKDVSVPGA